MARQRIAPFSALPTITVQAPQSPSAQPSLLPVRPFSWRSQSSTVSVGSIAPTLSHWPSNKNRTFSLIQLPR